MLNYGYNINIKSGVEYILGVPADEQAVGLYAASPPPKYALRFTSGCGLSVSIPHAKKYIVYF